MLAEASVLVIAHPSDPKWEATVNGGSPLLERAEIEAIEEFVRAGGGLVVLGETEQDKYGANLNDLLHRFGVEIESATVQDYEHHYGDAPSWVLASLGDQLSGRAPAGADPLAGVDAACFYRAGVLRAENGARVIARSQPTASVPNAPLAAVVDHGAGRVVVTADSDLFGDDCIADLDHQLALAQPRLLGRAARRSPSAGRRARLGRRGDARTGLSFATRSRSCASPRSRTARSTPPSTTRRGCAS